ncbi:MAG: hypothetical protein ACK5MG_01690 [Bacteroidales bacterium]
MRIIMSVLCVCLLVSCSGNKPGVSGGERDASQSGNKNPSIVDSDFLASNEEKRNEIDIRIYELELYQKEEVDEVYLPFISLTDGFSFSDDSGSAIIDKKYLGSGAVASSHYLKSEYRKRFLKQLGVSEDDTVFVYNYKIDSLFCYPVNDLALIARTNNNNQAITQYDYLVGFDLSGKYPSIDIDAAIENFVYIGKDNPFITGKLQPFVWTVVDKLPKIVGESFVGSDSTVYKSEVGSNLFFYTPVSGKLLVVNKELDNVVYNVVFYQDSETGLTPLNYKDEDFPEDVYQWTGELFEGKAPVIFGFEFLSSGCGEIRFVDKEKSYIRVSCDNRF